MTEKYKFHFLSPLLFLGEEKSWDFILKSSEKSILEITYYIDFKCFPFLIFLRGPFPHHFPWGVNMLLQNKSVGYKYYERELNVQNTVECIQTLETFETRHSVHFFFFF